MHPPDDMSARQRAAFLLGMVFISFGALWSQLDGRSFPSAQEEEITVHSNFWELMKKKRSPTRYRRTVRCSPNTFDALCAVLEPRYYAEYGMPKPNAKYAFDHKLAVLLTYYGNGSGQEGGGIDGAAAQLGMSRTSAGRYIEKLEYLLEGMKDEAINFPAAADRRSWRELKKGFKARGGLFPDVACVFDGTVIKTRRPKDPQGFYDKSFTPAYNCLFACDYKMRFRFLGVFTGSNSDQSMWNQSNTLGSNARYLCPPGVNWLADSGFKLLPFLMVPFDERGGKKLTAKQRTFNYHLSSTRMLVECAFGRLKARFKILHGTTDRKEHRTNARMIAAVAVLHNLIIDADDTTTFEAEPGEEEELRRRRRALDAADCDSDRTPAEYKLAIAKRNAYMEMFYAHDHADE